MKSEKMSAGAAAAVAAVVAYVNAKLKETHHYHETDLPWFWEGLRTEETTEEAGVGAFSHLTVREQHGIQQRGGDY